MKIINMRDALNIKVKEYKAAGQRVALVPTMGALHAGHLSLVDIARKNADKTIVSIFVNPTQFAPHEDLDSYPRTLDKDTEKLKDLGVDIVYAPDVSEIYADGLDTKLIPGNAASGLETEFRPHFFKGVVNVVSRLFDHVQPDVAVFGEKDYQQLCVIREMVKAHDIPVEIINGPIIRDEQGLALSSRNQYLTSGELDIARTLNHVLSVAKSDLAAHKPFNGKAYTNMLLKNGFDSIDYFALRDPENLASAPRPNTSARLLVAAWIGETRLIDNMSVLFSP